MIGRAMLCFALFAAAAWARAGAPEFVQDQAHFEAAVRDASTAPFFVHATIVDDRSATSWTGCVLANFIKGAIHIERDLGYDDRSSDRAERILIESTDHVFHFSKAKALENIAMKTYTTGDLERARAYLHRRGGAFLTAPGWAGINDANAKLNRTALACAIIERGFGARSTDRSAQTVPVP